MDFVFEASLRSLLSYKCVIKPLQSFTVVRVQTLVHRECCYRRCSRDGGLHTDELMTSRCGWLQWESEFEFSQRIKERDIIYEKLNEFHRNNSNLRRQLASSSQDVTLLSQSSANMWHDFHSAPLGL